MKLQIALDLDSADKAVAMAAQVYGLVDIIELGTPLMLKEGVGVVGLMKRRFPDALILADMKIADGGYMEARFAVEEGADIVTVLGMAEDETILGVKQATHEAGAPCLCGHAGGDGPCRPRRADRRRDGRSGAHR